MRLVTVTRLPGRVYAFHIWLVKTNEEMLSLVICGKVKRRSLSKRVGVTFAKMDRAQWNGQNNDWYNLIKGGWTLNSGLLSDQGYNQR